MKNIHILPKSIPQNIYITSDEKIKPNVYALINKVLCKTELLEGKIVSRQLVGGATMDICKSEYLEIILTTDQDLIKDGVQAIDDTFLEWFVKNPSCEKVEVDTLPDLQSWNESTKKCNNIYEIIIPKEERTIADMKCACIRFQANCFSGMCRNCGLPPKEEPKQKLERGITITHVGKQETLEEAADNSLYSTEYLNQDERIIFKKGCVYGAKWQQEDMIEKLEMHILINEDDWNRNPQAQFRNFIEQFK